MTTIRWRELKLPDAAKTLAADVTIRRSNWRPPNEGEESSEGSGGSMSDSAHGLMLKQRLRALPSVSIDEGEGSGVSEAGEDGPELLVIDELGRGGMGVVVRARQRSLEREVAVKRLRAKRKSQQAVSKLLEEARLTGALEHPNIVPIHALGTDERGDPVLIMKRIEGVVWRDLLRDPKHPRWQRIKGDRMQFNLEVLMQICRALEFAHSRQVLHRDVKPDNVMLGDYGETYLLDWGLGLHLDEPQHPTGLAAAHEDGGFSVVGTPSYMAPEMLTGDTLTVRTDVFLVGATLFEMLTGTLLNRGENIYDVLMRISERTLYNFDDSVPPELAKICNRATAIEPAERFASVTELREAISDYLRHRAAEQLVEGAHQHLEQLLALRRQDPDEEPLPESAPGSTREPHVAHALRVRKLATECRFGFQQALSIWPDSPLGRQGLQLALMQLLELEIEDENEAAAWALLNELDKPDARVKARVKALSAQLRQKQAKHDELEAIVYEQDIRVEERARGRQLLALMVPGVGVATAVIVARRFYGYQLTYETLIVLGIVALACVLLLVWRSRIRSQSNQINRRIIIGFFTMCSAVLFVRVGGWRVGASIDTTLLSELMLDALGGTMLAILVDNRLLRQSALAIACATAALAFPSYVMELLALGSLGALTWLAFDWIRSGEAAR